MSVIKNKNLYYILLANIFSSIGSGITMISIPWLLIHRSQGEQIFGYTSLFTTLILFLISPQIGVLIDKFSRKKLLIGSEIIGLSSVLTFSVFGMFGMNYETWHLIVMYGVGFLYWSFHYPVQFAFKQEIFKKEDYRYLNSITSVQGQVAWMIAGGLGSMMIDKVNLSVILMADAFTYIMAIFFFSLIPYHFQKHEDTLSKNHWTSIKEGYTYLKLHPSKTLFFACSHLPAIALLICTYLFPIHISKTLHANSTVLGTSEMVNAMGAILAGGFVAFILNRMGSYYTILIAVGSYTLSLITLTFFPFSLFFIIINFFLGLGSTGAKVSRSTTMMEMVPNEIAGRINSSFTAFSLVLRITLIGLFTQVVSFHGTVWALFILNVILILGWIGIYHSKKIFSH